MAGDDVDRRRSGFGGRFNILGGHAYDMEVLMGFRLSKLSLDKLVGVHPDLVRLVHKALDLSEVDFSVGEGARAKEQQAEYVRTGKSRTMDSRHLTGHAVDLWAFVDGKVSWDWANYFKIAEAVQKAAIELDTPVVWGGVWDKLLNYVGPNVELAHRMYAERRKLAGKKVFADGPHFELSRKDYPA